MDTVGVMDCGEINCDDCNKDKCIYMVNNRYEYIICQRPVTDDECFKPPTKDEYFLGEWVIVYSFETEEKVNLEEIYEKFNINHPKDYHARSLSISDLVIERDMSSNKFLYYIVDTIGFKSVTVTTSK